MEQIRVIKSLRVRTDWKPYGQETEYTCGPACLRWILQNKYNKHYSEKYLSLLCETNEEGTDHDQLVRAGLRFGYVSTGSEGEIERLIPECTIVGWDQGEVGQPIDEHYSVFLGVDGQDLWLMDPWPIAAGNIVCMKYRAFTTRWYDTVIEDSKINRWWMTLIVRRV